MDEISPMTFAGLWVVVVWWNWNLKWELFIFLNIQSMQKIFDLKIKFKNFDILLWSFCDKMNKRYKELKS